MDNGNKLDDDERDSEDRQVDEAIETWPAGLLASQTGAVGPGSPGGPVAAVPSADPQARELADDQMPREERFGRMPLADSEGDRVVETADDGVSRQQREAEADELNG